FAYQRRPPDDTESGPAKDICRARRGTSPGISRDAEEETNEEAIIEQAWCATSFDRRDQSGDRTTASAPSDRVRGAGPCRRRKGPRRIPLLVPPRPDRPRRL